MKTIIIWNEMTDKLRYAVLNGDFSRFHLIYVNLMSSLSSELSELVYDDAGNELITFLEEFPLSIVKNEDCIVIEAGFLP